MTTGSCLCGTVRWQADAPYERMSHCHCTRCRKAHGAPFATFLIVTMKQFRWLAGEDSITGYQSSAAYRRAFCGQCGSVVPTAGTGNNVEIPAGCLDDDPGIRPMRHIFVADKASWYEITDDLPQFAAYPAESDSPVAARPGRPSTKPGVLHGSCLCGDVEYEISTPIRVVHNCHCSRCRKARAAAHTTNGFTERTGLTFTKGVDQIRDYKLPEARTFTHSFCARCGSGMPNPRIVRPFVAIPLGSLDDDPGITAIDHIYTANKLPWFEISDDLPQFPEGPDQPPAALFQDN